MSTGSELLISEWLQTLKLEQYNALFENNDLFWVSELRSLSDEGLTKIGVLLPGHRKRILSFLQKSMSLEYPMEESVARPVPAKRNIFRGGSSNSEQELTPVSQNPLISFECGGQTEVIRIPPPIPPRTGVTPPISFSITPPNVSVPIKIQEALLLEDVPCPAVADHPITESQDYTTSMNNMENNNEVAEVTAPPLPAKRHRVENKGPKKSPPPIPARPPVVPPRIVTPLMPKSPPPVEERTAPEERQDAFPVIFPKPLPRVPPRDNPPKPTVPREVFAAAPQRPDIMDIGTLYELTGEIDGVVLTKFRSTKLNSFMSDDELNEDGSEGYEDVPFSSNHSDSDLRTCRSSSSLSSGISSTHSGNMEETETSSQHPSVIKAGWLDKNPPQGSYIFQKRWVRLDPDYLRYYDSEKDMYSKRFIKTSSISRVSATGDQKFEVATSNRNFVFRAESDADRNDWVKAFQQLLDDRRNRFSSSLQMSISQETADKQGLLEMRGCKPRLFVVVSADKVFLYKNAEDRDSGVGITIIDMNLGNVKDLDRKSFDLTTPYRTFSFSAESETEKAEWVEAMLQSVAEALSNMEVANKIWSVEANQICADCNAPSPDWASINLCVVICKRCAGVHRSLGPSISKVRSLKMDNKVWTEELIQLFQKIDNGVSNRFWAANVPPSEAIDMRSNTQERKKFVTAKYREGKYRRYHQLFGNQSELNKALCAAVITSDLTETQALVFCGADVSCSSGDLLYPHPIDLAEQAGQRLQMEFLQQNRTSEIPRLEQGGTVESRFSVIHPNITYNGFLYKTSSVSKPITERKAREEFSRRWCVLNDGVFSYYEGNHSSTPNGEIKMEDIVCVAVIPPDTHGYESTFEIYTRSERLYLFAADTPEEAKEWVKSITKCFLPLKAEELLSYDFDRIGRLQYKGGRSLECPMGWFSLCKTKLYMFLEDSENVEVIHLKKLSEISNKDRDVLVLIAKGRITYIMAERRLDFSCWVNAIQEASSTTGDTLSEQQLTGSDVPVLVHKCIEHISQLGVSSEGIYRKSGQTSKTTSLLDALKKDARSVVLKKDEHHVDNVSDALKRFFRGIGEGIFAEHCLEWLNVTAIEDECMRIWNYQELLKKLPPVNRATLRVLISHLYCIQHFSDINQMNVHNLAIVFGPTLFQTDGQNYRPGRVVEDLINFYLPIFNVSEQDLQKELDIISKIISVSQDKTFKNQATSFICTVYLEKKNAESEHSVQIPVTMTAEDLTKTVLSKRDINGEYRDYWGCSEVDDSEELERPLHFSEKVLNIYHSGDNSSHLIVKKQVHMAGMLNYIKNRVGDTKNGTMKYREEKTLLGFVANFHDRYFMLNNTTLRMYREVRSHKPEKEWPVKNLTIYMGIKKKIRPPTSCGFTIMCKNEKQEKTQWYLCCDRVEEMREWFAAFTFVQHGSLWPEETANLRLHRPHVDSRFGNRSHPIRGSENEIRKSMSALTIDPLTVSAARLA
ncbi:LOW QUALITY PROTEIN: arf-GAP with Rho-GAP domain, ANK repeat and PH domain-containing protein 1 [Rhinophrynus dorsalis]